MLCGSRLLLHACLHGPAVDAYSRRRICDGKWGAQRRRASRRSPRSRIRASFSIQEIAQLAVDGPIDQLLQTAPVEEATPVKILQAAVLLPLIAFFAYRSYKKRMKALTEPKKEEQTKKEEEDELEAYRRRRRLQGAKQVSPADAAVGAVLAGIIAWAFLQFTLKVDSTFAGMTVSSNDQVARISNTIRSIVVGTLWLGTTVFGVNSVGMLLAGLDRLIKGPPEEAFGAESIGEAASAVLPPQNSPLKAAPAASEVVAAPAASEVVAATEVSSEK